MSLPIVNISSDSDSSSSDSSPSSADDGNINYFRKRPKIGTNHRSHVKSVRTLVTNKAKIMQAAADSHSNKSTVNESVPLFKITFRDELTSRKYRRRIEDIIKYVLASQVDEEDQDAAVSNLTLDIFDPVNENKTLVSTTETVPKQLKNVANDKCELLGENKFAKKAKRKLDEDAKSPQLKKIRKNCGAENKENNGQSSIDAYKDRFDESYFPKSNLETSFNNNSVKIGSFGYFIQDKSIFISKDGLTFFVPTFKNEKQLKILSIELNEIEKVLVSFSKTKPALFFFVSTKTGEEIRKLLSMDDLDGPYFDPASKNLIHQHIAISPEQVSDESKNVIRELFKNKVIEEISEKAAADLIDMESTAKGLNVKLEKDKENCFIPRANIVTNKDQNCRKSADLNSQGHANDHFGIVTLFCRIVRVGSFEYAKKRVFSMSSNGVKFCVPLVDNDSWIVTINIDIDEIVKIAIKFSAVLPVIFCYISTKAARMIRKMLHMNDPNELCIDPDSKDDTRNKIIIFPQELSPDCKTIKELFRMGKLEELDDETADAILTRSISDVKENEPEIIEPRVMKTRSTIVDNECLHLKATQIKIGNLVSRRQFLNFNVSLIDMELSFEADRPSQDIHLKFDRDIIKAEFHLSKRLKAVFLRITTSCAITIRSTLLQSHNTNNGDPYSGRTDELLTIILGEITADDELELRELLCEMRVECIGKNKAKSRMANKNA